MKNKKKVESKYKLNEFKLELYKKINKFKETLKKDGSKSIKIKHLVKYIEFNNNSLMESNLDFIWLHHKFTHKFLEDILSSNYTYEDIIIIILQILCGNFSNTEKRYIKLEMQKLCSFYLCPINKNSQDKILFSLSLKSLNEDTNTYLYFISITDDWNFKDDINEFLSMIYNDNNFPIINYDKAANILRKEILFEKKEIDKSTGIELCYPIKNISINNHYYFKEIKIRKKINYIFNNPNDFILNEMNKFLIEKLEENHLENNIIEIIEGNDLDFKLSEQEKKYIKNSDSFILSGRPGTGKTTVILIKLFSIYYDYQIKKEKFELKKKFKKQKESNLKCEDLRIVFTSLSQSLCNKVEDIFEKSLIRKGNCKYKRIIDKDLKSFYSFRDVTSYPLFINFRKLIFMIDGSLTFQFFHRKDLKIFEGNEDPKSEFYYILNNYYECNNYINNENPNINFFYRNPFLKDEKQETIYLKEANENTFQKFYRDYLKNKKDELSEKLISLNLNYLEIYAQLNSIIKGSYSSHLYSNNCISKEEYKAKGRKLTDLPDLDSIYDICIKYEYYKKKNNYFDIQDLTNHLIRQVKLELIDIKLIDYLFIDEIQDLTINQIYLLILISRYIKVYAGDTCQTISKINRFRFSELKNILYNLKKIIPNYPDVSNAYLSINYRLNSNIIKMTTFLAYFIRELFPNTLDKFQDDFSIKIIDEKPIYISNINLLIQKLIKDKNEEIKNEYLSFCANHCFICRNKEYAEKLSNEYYNRIYTLSIEECKGLEYETVIISDFFSNSPFINEWNLFFKKTSLKNGDNIINDIIHEITNLLKFENIDYLNKTLNLPYTINENSIIEEIKKFIYPKCDKSDFDKHRLFEFCSELKQFYVIISRARTFIIFYETGRGYNCEFYNFCINHNLITKGNEFIDDIFYQNLRTYFDKNFKTNFEQYKNIALNFFNSGYYSRAKYLFKEIKEFDLMKEAEIYELYENIEEMKNNPLKKEEQYIQLNNDLIKKIEENNKFIDKKNLKGECYLNLNNYEEAIKCFENDPNKCGMIYFFNRENYMKAYEKFVIAKNYKFAIDCLIKLKDEEKLFNYINTIIYNLGKYKYSEIYINHSNNYFEKYILNKKKNIVNKDNEINNNDTNYEFKDIENKNEENNNEIDKNEENNGIINNNNEHNKNENNNVIKNNNNEDNKNKENIIIKNNKEDNKNEENNKIERNNNDDNKNEGNKNMNKKKIREEEYINTIKI